MMKPTVHMNGTSREELEKQFSDAYEAVEAALVAVRRAAPNGRDYYVQSPNAIIAAGDEHAARVNALMAMLGEYEALAASVTR